MRNHTIPYLTFLALLILSIPFSVDFAISVVPGWNTPIWPPYLIWTVIVLGTLLLVTIGYWILARRSIAINRALFFSHLALTMPTVILLKFPLIVTEDQSSRQEELSTLVRFQTGLIVVACILFVAVQISFLIYYFKVTRRKRVVS